MGVSLQPYRMRIGIFQSSSPLKTKMTTGPPVSQVHGKIRKIILLIILSCALPLLVQLNEASLHKHHRPRTCPTSTGCDPSSEPTCTPRTHWQLSHLPWPPDSYLSAANLPLPSPYRNSPVDSTSWPPRISATSYLSPKDRNRLIKATNGNRSNRGIKLAHWTLPRKGDLE